MLAQVLHIGNMGSHSRFFGTTSKIEMHGLRDLLTLVVGELQLKAIFVHLQHVCGWCTWLMPRVELN